MSKGKTLTGTERGRILELYKPNSSQRVMASEIGRIKTNTNNVG